MSQPINAAPFTNWLGIDDESTRAQTVPAQQTPTHLPLCYLYTAWGPEDAQLVSQEALNSIYDASSLDIRSKFFTTQSLYASEALKQGNQIMIKRLKPANAGPKARILLSLDIVADAVPQYQRNSDGTYKLDNTGAKIPVTGQGATLPGYSAKWVVNQWLEGQNAEAFGAVAQRAGSLVSGTGTQSTLYPIAEFEATFFGSKGNNLGLRLIAPTTNSPTQQLNSSQAERVKSFIYRLQMVSRASAVQTASVTPTRDGSQWMDFSFLPGAYDVNTDQSLDFAEVLGKSYSARVAGQPAVYGPFENAKIYQDQLQAVLAMIGAAEAPLGLLPVQSMDASSDSLYTVNPFTAVNFDGVPYYTLTLAAPDSGGSLFTTSSTFYAKGGFDGTMSAASYDTDVATAVAAFDMQDLAKYPFSVIYDSGYSLATKKAIITLLGQRPDIYLTFSTQSVLDPQNTPEQDSSIARSLAAAIGNYPESTVYGTAACRAMIVGSSGKLLNSNYTGLVPLTLQICKRFSAYMGAANGIWKSTVPPDENPQNIIDAFRDVNASYKDATARSQDWATGLVYVENFDMNSQYFPALASVYTNDTSILKGFMNVVIACDLIKIAHQVRMMLSGNSSLSDAQFASKSDQLIKDKVKGRYAGRVQVQPQTFYSTQDQNNGYSWSVNLNMYGNVMKTVGSATIIARRLSDLTTTS